MFIVIAITNSGKRLQFGRAYESHAAALDLAELARKEMPGRQVFVEAAPVRKTRHTPPADLADLLNS